METGIHVFVGLAAVLLTFLGAKSMFAPKSMTENFGIEPNGAVGLNSIRSLIGGLFLASVAMLVLGLVTGVTTWFLAVAIFMGVVAIGRVIGFVVDGFSKAVVPPLVVEIVLVGVLVGAHVVGQTAT